jgi:beta-glucosidase
MQTKSLFIACLAMGLAATWSVAPAQESAAQLSSYPYQDASLSATERARDLLGRLTLDEKAILMQDISEAIPRLGIKKFNWWSEALHGYANQGNVTVFPEPIGMAASFDEDLVYRVFDATSTEARAKYNQMQREGEEDQRFHSLSVWTPNVNIFRDPRWGRGQETYGEDPYLTSRMGVQVVKGLQGPEDTKYRKLWACAKHYAVHSGPEWSRHVANINNVSPRDLWETYMPAFKATVQEGRVREVMCAYQRLDDDPCCGSNRLLQQILRDEWGFPYLVVSDCGAVTDFWTSHHTSSDAVHAAAVGTLAGTDVECGFDYVYKSIPEAVKRGLLTEEEVDKHVLRLLEGRFDLGEMDDPSLVSWSSIPMSEVNNKEKVNIALRMAQESMTLLQNRNGVLPLSKKAKVAVVGPNAADQVVLWGNYNGTPNRTVTILEGIRSKAGKQRVTYERGCDLVNDKMLISYYDQCSFEGKKGVKGSFWNNPTRQGQPVTVQMEPRPISVTTYGQHTFAPDVALENFSASYQTVFRPTESGQVLLSLESCGKFQLRVNGELKQDMDTWRTTLTRTVIDARAGEEYQIEILYEQVPTWAANLKFNLGREVDIDFAETIDKLKDVETVVFVGGIAPSLEGEEMPVEIPGFKGGDRTDIELPAVQRRFLRALKQAGKKVVLVSCSGSAIAFLPETESCDAILQAWYPGEQGGQAVADVLYGDYNPCGKLPVTFYKDSTQLPDFEDYAMKGRTYRYMEDALFPFGYGLSYTSFQLGEARQDEANPLRFTVEVKNQGSREGTEVVQVYIRRTADVNGPLKSLRAFRRVTVAAGKSETMTLELQPKDFETFDEHSNTMRVVGGEYEVYYGTSSDRRDLKSFLLNL